jgi:hypothetical protein
MLVAMMLTPPTLSHLLWSLPCPLWLQHLMSSTRAFPMTRLPHWQESFTCCTSSARRGDHLGVVSSVATPPTSSLIAPKEKKFNSSNKYDYNNRNDYSNKGDHKKKNHFGDKKKKKKFPKIMSRECAALSNFEFLSEDSSSSEEDEKVKCKQGDFTGLCLMGKSSRNASDSDSDVSDDLSFESLSLKVSELENALCNQDKLLCRVFRENKKLNLEIENFFF